MDVTSFPHSFPKVMRLKRKCPLCNCRVLRRETNELGSERVHLRFAARSVVVMY